MEEEFDRRQEFNRYINLDTLEGRILYYLVHSHSSHALDLWNMLEYNTSDCLTHIDDYFQQPEVKAELEAIDVSLTLLTPSSEFAKMVPSKREVAQRIFNEAWEKEITKRWDMVYLETDEASGQKVFLMPFVDDAWKERSARLDIYLDDVEAIDHISSVVLVGIDIIVHNKIINIDNPVYTDNPAEFNEEDIITSVKSRTATMLRSVLAELNGAFVAGIGLMQVNSKMSKKCGAKRMIWNNREYVGHQIIFGAQVSGVSAVPSIGY